jgi:hypothetical protein
MKGKKKIDILIGGMILVLAMLITVTVILQLNKKGLKEETAKQEGHITSKAAVMQLDLKGRKKLTVGNRKNMTDLTIIKNGKVTFEIKKKPSENQTDFKEWYVTKPYRNKQLVNISDIYDFLDYYASWGYIEGAKEGDFVDSGVLVEEKFSDSKIIKIRVGKKAADGSCYIKTDYLGKVYKVDAKELEAMINLRPYDFIMGIANLVYLTTVDKLQIQTDKTEASFDIQKDDDNNQVYTRNGKILEKNKFKEMYSAIISIVISGEAEKKNIAKHPVLQLIYKRNDDKLKNIEISYYPYNEQSYIIARDGRLEFLADKTVVDEVIKKIDKFCQ